MYGGDGAFPDVATKMLLPAERRGQYSGMKWVSLLSSPTCFFALIYVRTRDAVQEQIFNRFFFTFWLVVLPCAPAASLWAVAHNGASHRASRLPPPPSSRLALSWLVLTLTSPLVR